MDEDIVIKRKKTALQERAVFSILIPTWNNLAYLKLCIHSIRKNSSYAHQIIVHINEGTDGTLDWVESQTDIDFSHSKTNVGVCYALNAGRDLVSTNYIVYINDDMYVCPGWDAGLMEEIKKTTNNYFFFSATAIEPFSSSNCAIEKDFGKDFGSFNELSLLKEFSGLQMSDWQGATWPPNVVHKETWDLVGGYSLEFSPGMYSDPDFSMKLWEAGVRLFKGVGRSRVYHFGSRSTKRVAKNKGYYTFIAKWKITSGTFTRYYLRRGKAFDGELKKMLIPGAIKLKNFFRRISLLWKAY
jgi:glycosyltransferase involved in cell wall biosynthesis